MFYFAMNPNLLIFLRCTRFLMQILTQTKPGIWKIKIIFNGINNVDTIYTNDLKSDYSLRRLLGTKVIF